MYSDSDDYHTYIHTYIYILINNKFQMFIINVKHAFP